jgi:uncharacterized membrane protein YeaQ/YmgE (transglycosylase-associated protein family)
VLILGLVLFGRLVGGGTQLILSRSAKGVDWSLALVAGLVGSFVGGLLISLFQDGLQLRPSGFIGSLVGRLRAYARELASGLAGDLNAQPLSDPARSALTGDQA